MICLVFESPHVCMMVFCSDWSNDPVCYGWSTVCSTCWQQNPHQQHWIMPQVLKQVATVHTVCEPNAGM